MENISYHGTSMTNANKIIGSSNNVDVTLGRGELGQGFYTGTSIAIAVSWANKRFGKDACVIKIEVDEEEFIKLDNIIIKSYLKVQNIWQRLRHYSKHDKFKFGTDYVMAPFATIEMDKQIKFESKKAEKTINCSKLKLISCS